MGKFRSKLKGRMKGKRWPKGQSSSSNPETRKHRDQAKSRFFEPPTGVSNLTSEALQKHDAIQAFAPEAHGEPSRIDNDDFTESTVSTYQTMQTFASEWSNCSNMSYSRFMKVFRSDSSLHKEMLAILAAVTEVIKEKGGKETSVEYYCTLLTTLEQVMSQTEKNETQLTAVLSLLNMGIKTVPEAVLRSSFDKVWEKLRDILQEYSSLENNVVVKSIFGMLTAFLRAQDWQAWSGTHVQAIFCALLDPFCVHSKPKWRKSAQQAVSAIIRASCFSDGNATNFAANKVFSFCKSTFDECLGGSSHTVEIPSMRAAQTTILHTLALLKETICFFAQPHVKASCEMILQLMTLNSPMVTSCCLQVLHALLSFQKPVLQGKTNAQLISALYEYKPSPNDVQPMTAWLAVMQQAHIHLADVDLEIACNALPRIFTAVTQLWLSEKKEIITAATHTLEALLRDAVSPACSTPQLAELHKADLLKCFNTVELGLGYQYNFVWHQVLHVIRVMFETCGENCSHLFVSCLKTLSELRDSYKFSYNSELEYAVGAAVRSMGPESVLEIISLKKDNGEMNLDRSWMLLVLRENIKRSTVSFWIDNILPLAFYCQKRSVQLGEANDGIGAHSYELLYLQLWHSLPSFCNNPTDIKASFKNIAKVLGTAISDRKELRLPVMAAIRKLIAHAKLPENAEDLAEIARFDKNYLPILFNVYTTRPIGSDEEGQRLAAFDTIKVYLSVARPELLKQLFTSALEKMKDTNDAEEAFLKESVMDLVRALVPYQGSEEIAGLYKQCVKNVNGLDSGKEQKKAYRLLEEICGSEAEGCKAFVQSNRRTVQRLLMKSMNSSAVTSKGARLRCYIYLVRTQPQLDYESKLIKSAVPEAVLCCKDVNQRCRASAYQLLNTIGETLQKHNQMGEFVAMVVAGLAGPPQMMSATILALSSILHNFSGALGQENIQLILENVSLLISCSTREIVASSLSFIKVYCASLPSPTVALSLPNIMKTLCSMTGDCKRHFRLKIRDIVDRLLRKYGHDTLIAHVPESDAIMRKRLRNLRKLSAKKKRIKEERKKESEDKDEDEAFLVKTKPKSVEEILADSDSEIEDMETTNQPKAVKGKKQSSAWIEEDEDSIVDFMDPSVASKITATNPAKPSAFDVKKKSDRGFKTAPDGRLIIEDLFDSDDEKNKVSSDEDSDDDDNQSKAETLALSDRKRKRGASSVKTGSVYSQPPSKYRAGGSGIHRPVGASRSASSVAGSEFKSKKAAGDVKRKGKLDPFAYLPLQRSSLNKRKKMKNAGKFKHLIGAAKSGARKGMKTKRRKNKTSK